MQTTNLMLVSLYVWLGYVLGIFPYIHATQRTIVMQRTQVIKTHGTRY